MSKKDPWVHIKIHQSTRDRLHAIAARLVQLVEEGRIPDMGVNPEPKDPSACGLSFDRLINHLLDQRDGHNRRARKSRARNQRARPAGETAAGTGDESLPPGDEGTSAG